MKPSTQLAGTREVNRPFSLGLYLMDHTNGKEFDFIRIRERGETILVGITYDDNWTDGTYLVRDGDTFHLRPLERIEPELRRASLRIVGKEQPQSNIEILGRAFCRVRMF